MAHHVTGGQGISIVVFDAPSSIYQYMLEKFREISSAAAAERGFCTVALSGGQTPVGFYREAAAAEDIDWSRTHIFQVDERFVPPSDSRSNFRMIRQNLLDPAAVPGGNVYPIPVRGADADACAVEYAREIRAFFAARAGVTAEEMPRFDLVMLGMGEDGHTASLFPASGALEETDSLRVPYPGRRADCPHYPDPARYQQRQKRLLSRDGEGQGGGAPAGGRRG